MKPARYAGLLNVALAAIALGAGMWLAGAHPAPVGPEQPAAPHGEAIDAPAAEYANAWATTPVEVNGGVIPYLPLGSKSGGYVIANGLIRPTDIYQLPSQGALTSCVPEGRCSHAKAQSVDWLTPDDMVYGVRLHGESRCYPQNVLARHCIVNDRLAGERIVVYYDPLSRGAVALVVSASHADGDGFRVVGYGYGGAALMGDTGSDSLWDVLGSAGFLPGTAVTGPAAQRSERLTVLSGEQMRFSAWTELWPDTSVMSVAPASGLEGMQAEYTYDSDPYTHVIAPNGQTVNYYQSDLVVAPAELQKPDGLRGKEEVLGVRLADGTGLAIPLVEAFGAAGDGETEFVRDNTSGQISLLVDRASGRARVTIEGNVVPSQMRVFWFAWHAHYPDSAIWHVVDKEN